MLKKFVKSKIFVLSMLVASVAGNARGMNQNFDSSDENYNTFGNSLYFLDDEQYDYNFSNSFLDQENDQGNDGQLQDTNAAPPANQQMDVVDEEEFAWCTEEEFNKWCNEKEATNVFQINAKQTNPQTYGRPQLCPDGWEGSAAEKFCIIHDLTAKNKIRHFVANMRALGYAVPPIPNDPVDGRRVFRNDVYPILADLSEEKVQRIKNYVKEREMTVLDEAAIIEQWKESKIRRYVKDANLTKRGLISLNNHLSTVIPGFPRVNRKAGRNKLYLLRPLLQFEPEILSFMKFETFLQFE